MALFVLHFLYLIGLYPWDVSNVCFTFMLCVIALCMMYVYLYMLVYGWLCTLYDGLLWLREWLSLVMRALNLVVCVCAQGDCHRCIFMLYCVHNHLGMKVRSMSPSDTGFAVYVTCINTLDILKGFGSSQYKHVDTRCILKCETLLVRHSAPNAKLYRIFTMKMRHPVAIFS